MIFLCYPKCSTCQKAKKWLVQQKISFTERDIKQNKPSKQEIQQWHQLSGLPLKKFFNTSGLQYRALMLKDKLPGMNTEEQYDLLATDGMLVRRPILIGKKFVLVGFKQDEWHKQLIDYKE